MQLKQQIIMACKMYHYNDVLAKQNDLPVEYLPGIATPKITIEKQRRSRKNE